MGQKVQFQLMGCNHVCKRSNTLNSLVQHDSGILAKQLALNPKTPNSWLHICFRPCIYSLFEFGGQTIQSRIQVQQPVVCPSGFYCLVRFYFLKKCSSYQELNIHTKDKQVLISLRACQHLEYIRKSRLLFANHPISKAVQHNMGWTSCNWKSPT